MYTQEYFIVFPEGDTQEVDGRIPVNTLVDVNGRELMIPLKTNRMIAYRIAKVRTVEKTGISETYHYLEQMSAAELNEYL